MQVVRRWVYGPPLATLPRHRADMPTPGWNGQENRGLTFHLHHDED